MVIPKGTLGQGAWSCQKGHDKDKRTLLYQKGHDKDKGHGHPKMDIRTRGMVIPKGTR